jgi:microcystin-dependent protein
MSQSYVGEVRLVGFNFAPAGWQFCNGQQIPISEFSTLFQLIGTTYGGDGQSTFCLPNLQGRVPLHQGNNGVSTYVPGETGGVESVTINLNQYPTHTHLLQGSGNNATLNVPTSNTAGVGLTAYSTLAPTLALNAAMVGLSGGGSQPHENRQPYLALNWVISLFGVFPSQG